MSYFLNNKPLKRPDIRIVPCGNGTVTSVFLHGPLVLQEFREEITLTDEMEEFLHAANLRVERLPVSTQEYPFIRPLPAEPVTFNDGEGNEFPALALFDANYQTVVIEADMDQTRFRRYWTLQKGCLTAYERYDMSATPFELKEGETVEISRVYRETLHNTHPAQCFEGYRDALKKHYTFASAHSDMIHHGVYCTWNYGVFANINEGLLLKRATILAEKFPECTHFMIDSGWQNGRVEGTIRGFECMYPDPDQGADPVKFPSGMKYLTDRMRAMGLTPGIWFAPVIQLDSQLAKDHPDWLMRDESGDPALISNYSYPDLSVKGARGFVLNVFDTLFLKWGFSGLKFDFMTQWFTMERAKFKHGSACEWRDFLYSEIRKRIGEKGIFLTCIAMSMGNPFPGRFADCYRCGRDIHGGTIEEQISACRSTLPQILFTGKDLFLPNFDSAGFAHLPDHVDHFRLVWTLITQGIPEFGGAVEEWDDAKFIMLRKTITPEGRGNRVRCPDENAFRGMDLPAILETDHYRAWFNWSTEKEAEFQADTEKDLKDYLNDTIYPGGKIVLPPFSAAIVKL